MRRLLAILITLTLSGPALADECSFDIEVGDALAFSVTEMSVPETCGNVTVNLVHTGSLPAAVMGHNWALSATSDFEPLAQAGLAAGQSNAFLPPDDDRVLAYTRIIGAGEKASVTFSVERMAGRDLTFFCSFPGHWTVMKGRFKVE